MRDLDARYLYAFHVAAAEGGFGRAARRLHLSQPAVSHQVRRLEEQLGTRLIDRSPTRFALTPVGRRLFGLSREFFERFAELVAAIGEPEADIFDPVRVASVSGFGRYVLYPLLRDRFAHRPFELTFPTADEVFAAVEAGSVDLGVVYQPRFSQALGLHPIRREELVLIAGGARRAPVARGSLEGAPWITYVESEPVFAAWFRHHGRRAPAVASAHRFEELEEVVDMVRRGHGVSIVPADCAREAIARRALAVWRPGRRRVWNQIYAVTRAGVRPRPAVRELLGLLRRP
jgi:DNA-binding transcriptional LysR family regulator